MIHIFQPAMPSYRLDFFRRLSKHYGERMRVHYSPVDMGVLTSRKARECWENHTGLIRQIGCGIEWQEGAVSVAFHKGDIVVVCGAPRTISTIIILMKARMIGAHTIWWGQYWSATTKSHRHRLRMKLCRLANAILFYTDAEVSRFHADGWSHPGAVGALNNGLDTTKVLQLRHPYVLSERKENLLFIGRLTDKAQLNLLIAALAEPVLANSHLHVIGDGSEEKALLAQASALGITRRITWHGGTTDEAYIAQVANDCAAFVYPGQVGLSLIHAMSYGLPCVVHDQPRHHMPEIAAFESGGTGLTFKEGDSRSLALTIGLLLRDHELRSRMAERCLVVTEHNYTTEGMAARFVKFVGDMSRPERI